MPMFAQNITHFLAIIADAYTPILLLLAIIDIVLQWQRGNKLHGLRLMYAIIIVYSWMFADNYFQWWSKVGLDYSTHTAAALGLVVILGMHRSVLRIFTVSVSLFLYGYLMYILHYHSWSDMLTTAVVIGICILPLAFFPAQSPHQIDGALQ